MFSLWNQAEESVGPWGTQGQIGIHRSSVICDIAVRETEICPHFTCPSLTFDKVPMLFSFKLLSAHHHQHHHFCQQISWKWQQYSTLLVVIQFNSHCTARSMSMGSCVFLHLIFANERETYWSYKLSSSLWIIKNIWVRRSRLGAQCPRGLLYDSSRSDPWVLSQWQICKISTETWGIEQTVGHTKQSLSPLLWR